MIPFPHSRRGRHSSQLSSCQATSASCSGRKMLQSRLGSAPVTIFEDLWTDEEKGILIGCTRFLSSVARCLGKELRLRTIRLGPRRVQGQSQSLQTQELSAQSHLPDVQKQLDLNHRADAQLTYHLLFAAGLWNRDCVLEAICRPSQLPPRAARHVTSGHYGEYPKQGSDCGDELHDSQTESRHESQDPGRLSSRWTSCGRECVLVTEHVAHREL
jgi:hypothetical protein